ncbi:adenine deaminase [Oleiharenicola lentus]|uniref:adenine deaminase n=1 Tax=Oleiharenicola lentus TaxID=2508720 RepID=UPI003F67AAC7
MKSLLQRIAGNIVDIHRRVIFPGVVEWQDGIIHGIIPTPGGKYPHYLAPGFVDAHIHIESSMLPPSEFARWAVVHGTVATVSDPHEIANVLGVAGVDYMIRDGKRTPFKFNFGAPSCVPATTFESAGATLDGKAVAKLLARKEIKYLSEVMNFPGVLARDPSLMAMIAAAKKRGKVVDGHAPALRGEQARDYAAAGITTDHECFTLPEAEDKVALGMKILIREGSAARNFAALAPLTKTAPQQVMFCCDDLHPDLLMVRQIDEHVRRALRAGADKFDVLRSASLNPVEHYKLDVGLLRVGDAADFIVFEGWENLRVRRTYLRGELVAKDGRSLLKRQASKTPNKFKAEPRRVDDFCVKVGRVAPDEPQLIGKNRATLNVIDALNGQLITKHVQLPARIVAGVITTDVKRDILKIAVVNRYSARAPVSVGFIRGFGLKAGAIASSVAHDSHNLVAVGVDDESLCAAVNLVIKSRGGIAVVGRDKRAVLPLPIAGLMSDLDGRVVAKRYTALDAQAKKLGSKLDAPFMTLSFMALLVIPDLKLSDRGLFSATKWNFVPVAQGGA